MAEQGYKEIPAATFGGEVGTLTVEWKIPTSTTDTGKPYQVAQWEKISVHLFGATAGVLQMEGSLENFDASMSSFGNFVVLHDAGDPATPVDASINFATGSPPKMIIIHGPINLIRPNASATLSGEVTVRMLLQNSTLRR